jgi:hypothetical protein
VSKYRKTIVAVVGAALAWSDLVIGGPAAISATEWRVGAVLLATALGVYAAPNKAE